MNEFSIQTPTQEPGLDTAMKVVYQWNYDPEVEELRTLYVKQGRGGAMDLGARHRLGPADRSAEVRHHPARRRDTHREVVLLALAR
jgi:hypothetical protein